MEDISLSLISVVKILLRKIINFMLPIVIPFFLFSLFILLIILIRKKDSS